MKVDQVANSAKTAELRGLRPPVTMDLAARLESAGLYEVAAIARRHAVDRPRWWHRLPGFARPVGRASGGCF